MSKSVLTPSLEGLKGSIHYYILNVNDLTVLVFNCASVFVFDVSLTLSCKIDFIYFNINSCLNLFMTLFCFHIYKVKHNCHVVVIYL